MIPAWTGALTLCQKEKPGMQSRVALLVVRPKLEAASGTTVIIPEQFQELMELVSTAVRKRISRATCVIGSVRATLVQRGLGHRRRHNP